MELYSVLSPEELRWVETSPSHWGKEAYLEWMSASRNVKTSAINRIFTIRKGHHQRIRINIPETTKYLTAEGILPNHRKGVRIKGEYVQLSLLKLLAFAEKYGWGRLFNDAIDQYKSGEEQMDREAPHPRHVELVYTLFDRSSTVFQFMADYAASKALKSKKHSGWVISGLKIPEFLITVAARVDGKVPILGYNVGSGHWAGFKRALDNERGAYHMSNESCALQHKKYAQFQSVGSRGTISNQRTDSLSVEMPAQPLAPVSSTGENCTDNQNASPTRSQSERPQCGSRSSDAKIVAHQGTSVTESTPVKSESDLSASTAMSPTNLASGTDAPSGQPVLHPPPGTEQRLICAQLGGTNGKLDEENFAPESKTEKLAATLHSVGAAHTGNQDTSVGQLGSEDRVAKPMSGGGKLHLNHVDPNKKSCCKELTASPARTDVTDAPDENASPRASTIPQLEIRTLTYHLNGRIDQDTSTSDSTDIQSPIISSRGSPASPAPGHGSSISNCRSNKLSCFSPPSTKRPETTTEKIFGTKRPANSEASGQRPATRLAVDEFGNAIA
jgi:hypothetical protein